MTQIIVGAIVFLLIISLVILAYLAKLVPWGIWWSQRWNTGCEVPISVLAAMNLRKVPVGYIVEQYTKAKKAGILITIQQLEIHHLSNGNIANVVQALISASKSNKIHLSFEQAASIDLAGRNVNEAVIMSINPKVLKSPVISAVAKDGIELRTRVNITVRTNLDKIVGGAGEDTILARVGEGVVTTIGSAPTHKDVLNNPSMISEFILNNRLDSGSAFEIVSLDIADIDVGRNIGAALKNAQAIADRQVAEAKAEGRKANAEATVQENKAAEQEARANLVKSEMKIPLALAETFRSGKLIVKRNKFQPKRKSISAENQSRAGLSFGDDE